MNNFQSNSNNISKYLSNVFSWMGIALLLTFSLSLFVALTPSLANIFIGNNLVFFAVVFFQIFYVIKLSSNIRQMSFQSALTGLLIYSGLNGLIMSYIYYIYSPVAIIKAFTISALLFILMSLFGKSTKFNLQKYSTYLFFALLGLLIAIFVNIFFYNEMFDFVISITGVLLFLGLTAYDVQKLKNQAMNYSNNPELLKKLSIVGALELYLDLINLFLFILRLGRNR